MVLNKRGQTGVFFLFMIAIVMFILGFELSSALVVNNNDVRTNMNCANESISTDQKISCGVTDIAAPWITGIIFALGSIAFGAKLGIG